jgi:hypothetical protein
VVISCLKTTIWKFIPGFYSLQKPIADKHSVHMLVDIQMGIAPVGN